MFCDWNLYEQTFCELWQVIVTKAKGNDTLETDVFFEEDFETFDCREQRVGYFGVSISYAVKIDDCKLETARKLVQQLSGSLIVIRGSNIVLKVMCTSYPVTVQPFCKAPFMPPEGMEVTLESEIFQSEFEEEMEQTEDDLYNSSSNQNLFGVFVKSQAAQVVSASVSQPKEDYPQNVILLKS